MSTVLALMTGASWAADARAEDAAAAESYPYVEGELELAVSFNNVVRSDDPGNEINDLYPEPALTVRAGLTPNLAVNLGLTLEPVQDPLPFEDRYFEDVGLYVDTLNLEAGLGALTLVAGKFGAGFGRAWDNTPGVFGTDFAEDYELSEQIGMGASYAFETATAGTHSVGVNVFFADTSFMSDALFTRRGPLSKDDGGAGNTERLNNFSITLDGADIPALSGFSYHLGYRHLSAGTGDLGDEDGFVAGLAQEAELAPDLVLALTGEIAYFSNAGGSLDNATYVTPGLALAWQSWHGEVSGTIRRIDFDGGGNQTDHFVQLSAGYTFENGIDFSVGYDFVRDADVDSQVIGLRLTKTLEFSTR